MRSNACSMIEEIKGTKSTKIMELINRKLQDKKEAMLEKHIADKKLNQLYEEWRKTKEKARELRAKLEQRKEELDLEWTYDKKYRIEFRCRISKEDYDKLQEAQDLWSIGKKEKAKEIWEAMIKKHNLFGE